MCSIACSNACSLSAGAWWQCYNAVLPVRGRQRGTCTVQLACVTTWYLQRSVDYEVITCCLRRAGRLIWKSGPQTFRGSGGYPDVARDDYVFDASCHATTTLLFGTDASEVPLRRGHGLHVS